MRTAPARKRGLSTPRVQGARSRRARPRPPTPTAAAPRQSRWTVASDAFPCSLQASTPPLPHLHELPCTVLRARPLRLHPAVPRAHTGNRQSPRKMKCVRRRRTRPWDRGCVSTGMDRDPDLTTEDSTRAAASPARDPEVYGDPRWRVTLPVMWVAQLCSIMGFSFVMPFIPFFVRELGVTEKMVPVWAGLTGTGAVPASAALIPSVVPKHRLGSSLGLMQMAVFTGGSIGPYIGGIVADRYGYRIPFGDPGAFLLTGGILVL